MVVAIDASRRRDGSQGGLPLRLGARGVELIAPARLQASARQLQRIELVVGIALGERQLILQSAQDEIVARHFGDDADARILQRRPARADIGARRLDVAPHAAEQIEFPQAVESRLRGIEFAVMLIDAGQLPAAHPDCACSCPPR